MSPGRPCPWLYPSPGASVPLVEAQYNHPLVRKQRSTSSASRRYGLPSSWLFSRHTKCCTRQDSVTRPYYTKCTSQRNLPRSSSAWLNRVSLDNSRSTRIRASTARYVLQQQTMAHGCAIVSSMYCTTFSHAAWHGTGPVSSL